MTLRLKVTSVILQKTFLINIDSESESESEQVQLKLFELGLGYFEGVYPLNKSVESSLPVHGIYVESNGRLSIITEKTKNKSYSLVSSLYYRFTAQEFLETEFTQEHKNRIKDELALIEKRYITNSTISKIKDIDVKKLSLEQMIKIDNLAKELGINT